MTNCVKLGRAVTFIKYLASVASLIFLRKTLIRNKIPVSTSNCLTFVELVENEFMKRISQKKLPILLFLFNLLLLIAKILKAYN